MKGKKVVRGAGVLLPITSLPSAYGIGTLGKEAFKFIDLLVDLKQKYWQILPIGPTSYGDSPYQTVSAFAGNQYLIDLEDLVEEGLLTNEEIRQYNWGRENDKVDYEAIFENRYKILQQAFQRFDVNNDEFRYFVEENQEWLEPYALFMAIKHNYNDDAWIEWPREIREKQPVALERCRKKYYNNVSYWRFCQYEFYKQWSNLSKYAKQRGIYIIGDVPYYVALDSVDAWWNPEQFRINANGKPEMVSASIPDSYSKNGQIWGSPLYDWDFMYEDDYKWWRKRIRFSASLFDVIKFNHFSGIVKDYALPDATSDIKDGKWIKGPGRKFVNMVNKEVGDIPIIADTYCGKALIPGVKKLLNKSGWLDVKVLMFAFDDDTSNEYLPHNYQNTDLAVYAGTHDNDTIVGFFRDKTDYELAYLYEYLNISCRDEIPDALIRAAYQSVGSLAIIQMQDILKLGNEARMNEPSTVGYNWRWRLGHENLNEKRRAWIRNIAITYRR
ncbi:4-alpha-glucanotransferase [Lachnospiraceae bacterium C7]|nr:4-alpha-glucanotransferase [Lachnospiraceae bacterium C7]